MKITGLGSVLAMRFGVAVADGLVPPHPCSVMSIRPRLSRITRRRNARTRPRCGRRKQAAEHGEPVRTHAVGRGQADACGDRGRGCELPRRRAEDARPRALRRPLREATRGALVLASLLAAHQRGVKVRIAYNIDHPGPIPVPPPPETAPDAIEALPVATRGDRGRARPHAPQVRRARRRRRSGRDRRTGRTTRGRARRTSSSRSESPSSRRRFALALRRSCGRAAAVEGTGASSPRRWTRRRAACAPWFCPGHGEALSHRDRQAHRQARAAHPDRLAGAHVGADPRRRWSRSWPRSGATSPAWSTTRRSTRCSASGARTA